MLPNGCRYLPLAALAMMATMVSLVAMASAQDSTGADAAQKPYKIEPDGTTDWATFNGFRRYNGICLTCHGPDGAGSSFAPALMDSLKTLSYDKFVDVVVNGKTEVNTANMRKMPALGTDRNVMCYIDDIYAYLKARSDGVLGPGRPAKHAPKPADAATAEDACMAD